MIDYSSWEKRDFSPVNLSLDPRNPRVPDRRRGETDQPSLMALLIERYDIYGLAKSILEKGYFPDSAVVILRQDENNRIVLEGNRRVAALKLLLNPDSAPEAERAKFKRLSAIVNKALIQKIPVVVAPTREDAAPLLIGKHTQASKSWSVLMKAAYIQEMIGGGTNGSSETMAAKWDMSLSEFNRYIKMGKMYALACQLDLPQKVLEKLYDTENFPITTIERLISNPEVREALGLSQNLEEINDLEMFEKRYAKMITDVSGGKGSRTFDRVEDRKKYADELKDKIPDIAGKENSQRKTKIKVNEILKIAEEKDNGGYKNMAPPKRRSIRRSSSVIPSGVRFGLHNASPLKALFDEIRRLRVEKHENISAIALRVLLEKCLKRYLKNCEVKSVPTRPGKPDISVSKATLFPLLGYISAVKGQLIEDEAVKKTLRDFANGTDYPSLSMLNEMVHNEEYSFSEEQVRNLWPPLEKLFTIMLQETGGSGGQLQGAPQIPGG